MNEEDIVKSPVFRALNLMIDSKVGDLQIWIRVFKERVDQAYAESEYGTIDARVSYEDRNRKPVPLGASVVLLKQLADFIPDIVQLDKEIGELQRFKLRLLNDHDFTHGDPEDQKAVFGETVE